MKRDFRGWVSFFKLKTNCVVQSCSTSGVKITNFKVSESNLIAHFLSKHFSGFYAPCAGISLNIHSGPPTNAISPCKGPIHIDFDFSIKFLLSLLWYYFFIRSRLCYDVWRWKFTRWFIIFGWRYFEPKNQKKFKHRTTKGKKIYSCGIS